MYQDISFARFALALAGLALPVVWLERSNERLARRYVWLLLLMLVIVNFRGLDAFATFLARELQRS